MLPFPFPWLRFCIFQEFSDDTEIKKSSPYPTNINCPFATVGNKYDHYAHAKMGGKRFRIPSTSRGFLASTHGPTPSERDGETSLDLRRKFSSDVPRHMPDVQGAWMGDPPRRPEKMCPDVQRECAPTSRENVPRRPERMDECITENDISDWAVSLDVGQLFLWTSGEISAGRRNTFSLDVGGGRPSNPLDVGAHFLWTSGMCRGRSTLPGTLRKTLRILRASGKCGGGFARSIGDFLAIAICSKGRNMLSRSLRVYLYLIPRNTVFKASYKSEV